MKYDSQNTQEPQQGEAGQFSYDLTEGDIEAVNRIVATLVSRTKDGDVDAFSVSLFVAKSLCAGLLEGVEKHSGLQAELRRLDCFPLMVFAVDEITQASRNFLKEKGLGKDTPTRKGMRKKGGSPRDFFSDEKSLQIAYLLSTKMEELRELHAAGELLSGLCQEIGALPPLTRVAERDTGNVSTNVEKWAKLGARVLLERPDGMGDIPEIPEHWKKSAPSRTSASAEMKEKTEVVERLKKAFMALAQDVTLT